MNAQNPRPKRQRKGDRLLNPDARQSEIAVDHGVAPFDRAANEMDAKWGIDRLPELVTPEMAVRYGQAVGYLNQCINENDPAKVVEAVSNCIRGLHALDAEATAAGHKPASGKYIEHEMDGEKIGILLDHAEWKTAEAERPDLTFISLRQVHNAWNAYRGSIVENVVDTFPGSTVKPTNPEQSPMGKLIDDEIPW